MSSYVVGPLPRDGVVGVVVEAVRCCHSVAVNVQFFDQCLTPRRAHLLHREQETEGYGDWLVVPIYDVVCRSEGA